MDTWYVVIDGKPAGPYSFGELKTLSLKPETFMKTSGMDDFKEAHEIPQIRELLGFKYSVTAPQYFATMDTRLIAIAIDYLIVILVCAALTLLFVSLAGTQFLRGVILAAGFTTVFIAKFLYACFMESSVKQGTFGKYWLGIKVCDEQGLRLDFLKAFIRNLAKLFSILTLGIGYMMGFFSKKQQCLHDRIAGTLVVKDRLL